LHAGRWTRLRVGQHSGDSGIQRLHLTGAEHALEHSRFNQPKEAFRKGATSNPPVALPKRDPKLFLPKVAFPSPRPYDTQVRSLKTCALLLNSKTAGAARYSPAPAS